MALGKELVKRSRLWNRNASLMRITTITSTSTPSDSAQAIYGFTGAECDAFQILIRKLNAKTMPLSITWRCPRSHVDLVNRMMMR